MMEKDLFSNLDNKKKYLFLSMNSACLTHCRDKRLTIPADKKGGDVRLWVDYKTFLGIDWIRVTTFEGTGFFDWKFDCTFAFGTQYLLSQEYLVYDWDGLKKEEMKNLPFLMKKVVRRKGKYEYGDDLYVESLNLDDSSGILYYTKEAKKIMGDADFDRKIPRFDLIKLREQADDAFREFDTKIKEGTLKEFEWS